MTPQSTGKEPLLSLHLSVDYPRKPGILRDVAMDIFPSEIHALVGESGSGKSTLSLAVLRLLEMKGGSAIGRLQFNGCDLMNLSERKMREVRGRQISLVLQSPHSSLNPALRIGTQLNEAWHAHANGAGAERDAKISTALDNVSLPADADFLRRYPSQLSVGQAQRVLIAMAILHRPLLLIADEPTSALDVITQSEILELFARLNRDLGTAILYISHDLLSVASLCHRLSILYEGTIVETGPTRQIFERPTHPYTRRLLEALPQSPFSVPQPSARLA